MLLIFYTSLRPCARGKRAAPAQQPNSRRCFSAVDPPTNAVGVHASQTPRLASPRGYCQCAVIALPERTSSKLPPRNAVSLTGFQKHLSNYQVSSARSTEHARHSPPCGHIRVVMFAGLKCLFLGMSCLFVCLDAFVFVFASTAPFAYDLPCLDASRWLSHRHQENL